MLRVTNRFNPAVSAYVKEVIYVLWGVFLLFLTSQITIPLEPVPITLQTFGVTLIALTFTRKAAIQSILTYLGLGALGVPVFANFRAGVPVFLGTTGGYLFGFLAAVVVMTSIKKYFDNEKFLHIALNCLLGTVIIYIFGVAWLTRFVGFEKALSLGFVPFIIPGIVKILLLAVSLRYIKFGRVFSDLR